MGFDLKIGLEIILGSIFTLIVTLIGINIQFKHERKLKKEQYEKEKNVAIRKIAEFLLIEINNNRDALKGYEMRKYLSQDSHRSYEYDPNVICLDEYENLKNELIKYDDEFIDKVIRIYHIFRLLKRTNNIKNCTMDEWNRMRPLFDLIDEVNECAKQLIQ